MTIPKQHYKEHFRRRITTMFDYRKNAGLCLSSLRLRGGRNAVNDNVTAHISNKCVTP